MGLPGNSAVAVPHGNLLNAEAAAEAARLSDVLLVLRHKLRVRVLFVAKLRAAAGGPGDLLQGLRQQRRQARTGGIDYWIYLRRALGAASPVAPRIRGREHVAKRHL